MFVVSYGLWSLPNQHPSMALWKCAMWTEWFWEFQPWERCKTFSVGQHRKVTHFPEGSQLLSSCVDICKATVAKESPPCSTVMPYFSPSSFLLPTTCAEAEAPGANPTAASSGHQQVQVNWTMGTNEKKKFQLQRTKPFRWGSLQHLSIQCDLQQLILFKTTGCLPLPSAGGLKGTHLMHQQSAWMGAASACISALLSLRADLCDGQKHVPLVPSSHELLGDILRALIASKHIDPVWFQRCYVSPVHD